MDNFRRVIILIGVLMVFTTSFCVEKPILFLSTQLNPVEEASVMKNEILNNFKYKVDFQPYSDREVFSYITKSKNTDEQPDIIGGLHGDFIKLFKDNNLSSSNYILEKMEIHSKKFNYLNISKFDGKNNYYIPWMQTSFIMVANKKALKYLPKNADINNLSYREFGEWGKNIYKATNQKKIGFPVGKNGLMHRFLQGYLYPSYTSGMVLNFNGSDAKIMWKDLKKIWDFVNEESLTYNKMDVSLLTEDVWVGWDHAARVIKVFKERPDDFIAFSAPKGPKGRGYMAVIAGLGIPQKKEKDEKVVELVKYLTSEKIQVLMANSVGFFPVINLNEFDKSSKIDTKIYSLYKAITIQAKNSNNILAMIPTTLGEKSGDFNMAYMRAFSQIVLRDKEIDSVLKEENEKILAIMKETNADYWQPDTEIKKTK